MNEIYSGAHVTLIAAGEDGLFSQEYDSDPTDPSKAHSVAKELSVAQCYETLSKSKWASRGWTFQEHILSRRSAVFLGIDSSSGTDLVFWDCETSLWDGKRFMPGLEYGQATSWQEDDTRNRCDVRRRGGIQDLSHRLDYSPGLTFMLM